MFPAALSGASRGRLRRDGSPARLGLGLRLGWHGERHRPLLRTVWSTSRGWHATAKSRSIRCGVIVPERWSRPNQALRAAPPRRSFARFVLGGASSDLERSVRPSLTPLLLVLHRQRLQCRRGGNLRMSRPADAEIRLRVDRCGSVWSLTALGDADSSPGPDARDRPRSSRCQSLELALFGSC